MVGLGAIHDAKEGLFAGVDEFPDSSAKRRYEALVGLEVAKQRLVRHATCLLVPQKLEDWARLHHDSTDLPILLAFSERPPMFVFAGDVGTGKTALAESFGDAVARETRLPITLFRLSLTARGSGAVGEMTQLLAAAFAEVRQVAGGLMSGREKRTGGVVLLIDEADALAQSRELAQMHHEDRAGVNELIRGIDDLGRRNLPVLVVMCSNRLVALDPAIRRRAADTFIFTRPDREQRLQLLRGLFARTDLTDSELDSVAEATGATGDRDYGFTYSDLAERLVQAVVLEAFPNHPITGKHVLEVVTHLQPTPPFMTE